MSFFLVFVASDIRPSHLAQIEGLLDDCHIRFSTKPKCLNPQRAYEIRVEDKPLPDQWEKLKELLAPDRIDVFVTSSENRRKKMMIADMDATIVTTETLDELAEHAGLKDKISAITKRAMAGELDFEAALNERVGMLKDLSNDVLHKTLEETQLSEGADILVKTMSYYGATCVLVSGGFTFFTKVIADRAGFHFNHGNVLHIENDALTGKVTPPILGKEAKLQYLNEYAAKKGISASDVFAIGDGANDLPMLEAAGLGVGYYPKPLVLERLDNNILYSDLTAALYIQGYTAEEINKALNSLAPQKVH
ncbi:MAG: phosphoserine phosphatase SerB [Micavibrio aeruginosavorus]|uniref:Phosphoserine phosphatase n=1 Tax=Micavibrio aeruginosavorus TaxID=349221 RepID=A0A2W5FS69_9BACT|nr:MAG: phosphoserine phosphatase SerB [Micavibrio aeruginosavorus]